MCDICQAAELAFEPVNVRSSGVEQCFQRDDFVAKPIVGRVNDAHAAGAETAADREALGAAEVAADLIAAEVIGDRGRCVRRRQELLRVDHDGRIQKTSSPVVRPQEPLHRAKQIGIAGARLGQPRLALGRIVRDDVVEDVVDPLPAIGIHPDQRMALSLGRRPWRRRATLSRSSTRA